MIQLTLRHGFCLLLLASIFACGSSSSNDTTPAEPVDAKRVTTSNIASLGSDIYNANLVGKPCGKVDKSTTCPGGGSVVMSGSFTCTTASTGVQSMNLDLTYVMTDCVEVRNQATTTLTGTMKHTGASTNLASVVTSEVISFQSSGTVKITSTGTSYKPLSESCEFGLTSRLTEAGGTSKVTGTLCGQSFSLEGSLR